jgi:hypothetical protein
VPTLSAASSSGTPTLYTGTGRVWRQWVDTSATTTGSSDAVWDAWSTTTSATTASATDVWIQWVSGAVNGTTSATSNTITWSNWVDGVEIGSHRSRRPHIEMGMSAEQRRQIAEERAEREARWAAEREEERRKRAEADERAMDLLRSVLNDEQNEDLAKNDYFFVKAKSGRLYRIDKGRSGNVKVVDPVTKVWQEKLCVHQQENVPYGDTMLMQKLLIETAEDIFRQYANIQNRNGVYTHHAKAGLLKGDELYNVLMFPGVSEKGEREEAAA